LTEEVSPITKSEIFDLIKGMPFPQLRIVRTEDASKITKRERLTRVGGHVLSEVIAHVRQKDLHEGELAWVSKDTLVVEGKRSTIYSDIISERVLFREGLEEVVGTIPSSLVDLLLLLQNRKVRYVETPVTRQVRRASGFNNSYREYIVVNVGDVKASEPNALRLRDIAKLHPALHAVRGHLRTYRADRYVNMQGKTQQIAPHVRGTGDVLQVKDYRPREH
jgi:hypothetical protein